MYAERVQLSEVSMSRKWAIIGVAGTCISPKACFIAFYIV